MSKETITVTPRGAGKREIDRLRAELAKSNAERDEAVDALKRIATYDYRGNRSGESQIARDALIAMRKGDGDGK
jgi:hypothetical protein